MPFPRFTPQDLFDLCEDYYHSQGYVNWADIARDFKVTRQAIINRVRACIRKGLFTEDDYERWSGRLARAAAARRTIHVALTPSNYAWIGSERFSRRRNEIVNGALDRIRDQPGAA